MDRIVVPTRLLHGIAKLNEHRLTPHRPLVIDGNWDLDCARIQDTDLYDKIHQFYYFGVSQRYSNHFNRVDDRIVRNSKNNRDKFYADADRHLVNLIQSFKAGKTEGHGKTPEDEPNFAIGRHGQILLTDGGRTRAMLAVIMGVKEIAGFVVARHPKWNQRRQKLLDHAAGRPTGNYQELMHPDLQCVPGWYTRQRAYDILKLAEGVKQFHPKRKTMIDVGANSGVLCEVFEAAGYKCMAIDNGSAAGMKLYRRASNLGYSILHDVNALDLDYPWKADVVLFLNILHHLWRESPEKLTRILSRMQANRIIFTAPNRKTTWKSQDEFAGWVSKTLPFKNVLKKHHQDGVSRPGYEDGGRFIYTIERA